LLSLSLRASERISVWIQRESSTMRYKGVV
jgi:hypothetical protein